MGFTCRLLKEPSIKAQMSNLSGDELFPAAAISCEFVVHFNEDKSSSDADALKSPLQTDLSVILFEIVCCFVGIPLNVFVTSFILRFKRLYNKPRNIFLLGLIFSNFLSFVRSLMDIYYHFWPSDLTCKVFMAFASALPDALLLLNSFFSLMDRYVAIRYPLWHRSRVTVPVVILVIASGFVLLLGILKFMYIAQLVPLRSQMGSMERTVIAWTLTVLFIMCWVARITVYLQTKRILRESDPLVIYEEEDLEDLKSTSKQGEVRINLGPRMSQRTISRLEMEATKVLAFGVSSLLLISFPLVGFTIGMIICNKWYSTPAYCHDTFGWLSPYLKQFGQVHGVYHPIIYLTWNEEFSSIRKCYRKHSSN